LNFLLELFFVSRQRKADVTLLNQTTIWAKAPVGSRGLPCRLKPTVIKKYNQAKDLLELWLPLRIGPVGESPGCTWPCAREDRFVLNFLLELFFVSRQRKADVALLNQTTIWAKPPLGSRGLPCRLKPADSRL
jgi:hypothetical protein